MDRSLNRINKGSQNILIYNFIITIFDCHDSSQSRGHLLWYALVWRRHCQHVNESDTTYIHRPHVGPVTIDMGPVTIDMGPVTVDIGLVTVQVGPSWVSCHGSEYSQQF